MWVKGVRGDNRHKHRATKNGVESILYLGVKWEKYDMVE
jgi:hypothetical protein